MKKLLLFFLISFTILSAQQKIYYSGHDNRNYFTYVEPPSIYKDRNALQKVTTGYFTLDPSADVPDSAITSLNKAIEIYGVLFNFSKTVKIRVEWVDNLSDNVNASTKLFTTDWIYNPAKACFYPVALANNLDGTDYNGSNPEMTIYINKKQKWYYGIDGLVPAYKVDLMTVFMHEILHGLGFDGSLGINKSNIKGYWGFQQNNNLYPAIFDSFVNEYVSQSYKQLVNTSLYFNPSEELGWALTSKNIYFNGPNAASVCGVSLPHLYNPKEWSAGSSTYHLDEDTYRPGNSNSMMTPMTGNAEAIHSPGEIALMMLRDLGWEVNRLVTCASPQAYKTWRPGETDTIKWSDTHSGSIDITLVKADGVTSVRVIQYSYYSIMGQNQPLTWQVPADIPNGQYRIRFSSGSNQLGLSCAFIISNKTVVAKPIIIPGSKYTDNKNSFDVMITCATPGAKIYYTLNGSIPDTNSFRYNSGSPFSVAPDIVVIAKAFKDSCIASDTAKAVYKYFEKVVMDPVFSHPSGTYLSDLDITISCPTPDAMIYLNYTFRTDIAEEPADPPTNWTERWSSNNPPHIPTIPKNGYTYIKVRAVKEGGWQPSNILERIYYRKEGILIQQVDENLTPFDSAAYCGYSVASWKYVKHDKRADIDTGKGWYFKASQGFKTQTTQKFHNWTLGQTLPKNDKINHTSIPIVAGNEKIYADFLPSSNAEICNIVEGITTAVVGGNISFKDPWRLDTLDGARGMRNRGMRSDYITRTSPLQYYTSNADDKGVFINQLYANMTYYSVKAEPILSNINGKDYSFSNWQADKAQAELQSPYSLETPVIFKSAGAKVYANYKGHLVSSSINANTGSNGRKLAYHRGVTYAVYSSMGSIWFTKKNTGSEWIKEINIGEGDNPSIHVISGVVHVVWQRKDPVDGKREVFYTSSSDGGSMWPDVFCIYDKAQNYDTTPIIIGWNTPVIVWCGADGLYVKPNPVSNPGCQKLMDTDAQSQLPSGASSYPDKNYLVYTDGNQVYYKEFTVDNNTITETPRYRLSGYNGAEQNVNPTITCSYNSVNSGMYVGVAYDGFNYGSHYVYYREKLGTNGFGGTYALSSGLQQTTNPSISYDHSSGKVTAMWQRPDGRIGEAERIIDASNPNNWSTEVNLCKGNWVNLMQNSIDDIPLTAMYVTGSTAPYDINFSTVNKISADTLQGTTTWSGIYYVMGNITVDTGAVLQIKPGTNIIFAGGASLIVKGRLDALGTPDQKITFTSASGTRECSWGSITINGPGSAGSKIQYANVQYAIRIEAINTSNIEISNCNILYTLDGIRFSGSTGTVLNNAINISSTSHGIIIENTSNVTCYENTLNKTGNKTGVGILFRGGGNGIAWRNDIKGWDWGIAAIWNSSPSLYFNPSGPPYRNNRIRYCGSGVMIYNASYPTIGGPYVGSGYNAIYSNYPYNIWYEADNPVRDPLYAYNTYWGGTAPDTLLFYHLYGCRFNTGGWLTNNPWDGLSKRNEAGGIAGSSPEINNQVSGDNGSYHPDGSIYDGIEYRLHNRFKEAKNFFISYIDAHPDDQAAYVELYNSCNNETADDIISFFSSLPKKALKEQKLLLSYLYLKQGDVKMAKKINNSIISENDDNKLGTCAKQNNIYIAMYNENDLDEAVKIFRDVLRKPELSSYVELTLTRQAIESYAKLNGVEDLKLPEVPEISVNMNKNISGTKTGTPLSFELSANYPNPFNPVTTIRYALPKDSRIVLEVYNILGEKVASLVDEVKSAGYHEAVFNGSNLSSGIYIYRLTANSLETGERFVKSAKMMLMK